MKKILLGLVMTLIMTANGYANEIEIKKIKNKHDAYYTYLFENDMNSLAKLFTFPAVFKGFVNEVQIAKNEKDIKNIYENLIKAAPQSKFVNEGRNYTEITTKVENKSIYKMRDDTYMIIVKYTQSDKKDNSLIFSGRASYLFIKDDEEWLISGVF
tara:strand:- start:845 stop:1312 length:468 start_codon:yes stop_codon:yes gene_type:complete